MFIYELKNSKPNRDKLCIAIARFFDKSIKIWDRITSHYTSQPAIHALHPEKDVIDNYRLIRREHDNLSQLIPVLRAEKSLPF